MNRLVSVIVVTLAGVTLAGCPPKVESCTLIGHVYNGTNAATLSGADVHVDNGTFQAITGADGSYRIENIPPGDHVVAAGATGFVPYVGTVNLPSGLFALDFLLTPQ
jgi:hypothetical protein